MAKSWTCPFCNKPTTVTINDELEFIERLEIDNSEGLRSIYGHFIVCPNEDCKKIYLSVTLFEDYFDDLRRRKSSNTLKTWHLLPHSKAKPQPLYIPKPIIDDYEEACLIIDLSPKASATLARRCLQGMISNFWKVNAETLYEEIDLIKDKVEPLTWKAIDAVRNIGNIGAHMEKDINLIISIEPNEAKQLINLIEILLKDWYINNYEKEKQLKEIETLSKKIKSKKS